MKDRVLLWLIVAGLVIAYIGIKDQNPIIIGLVISGAGAYSIFAGIQMIISKRAEVPTGSSTGPVERHLGLTAQLWGFLYILFGAIAILIALAMSVFRETSTVWVERFLSTLSGFGVLMVVAGGSILVFGIMRLISGNAPYIETKLVPFERIMGGIYFSLLGAGVFAIGLWLLLSPSTLKAVFNYLVSLIGKLIAG